MWSVQGMIAPCNSLNQLVIGKCQLPKLIFYEKMPKIWSLFSLRISSLAKICDNIQDRYSIMTFKKIDAVIEKLLKRIFEITKLPEVLENEKDNTFMSLGQERFVLLLKF